MRAKRTEWRMRGINLIKTQRRFPLIRLAFATLWQSTFPRGEGLIGCVHDCHFERQSRNPLRKKRRPRTRAGPLARGGSPPRDPLRKKRKQSYTNTQILARGGAPPYTDVISSVSREIPHNRNENNRTRPTQILARRGSLPRQPTRPRGLRAAPEKSFKKLLKHYQNA